MEGLQINYSNKLESLYSFLRKALRNKNAALPLRGPEFFKEDGLIYKSSVDGCISKFVGVERIIQYGETIYKGHFHGGIINQIK